jgi:diamine N-acetyltransferase
MLFIRPVEKYELSALRDFAELTFRLAFQKKNNPIDFEDYCSEAFSAEHLEIEYENPTTRFYFGTINDDLVAYLKLNFDETPEGYEHEDMVQLERIYVLSGHQGKEYGSKMLEYAEKVALDSGAEWIWLTVWDQNPDALRFYERHGFEVCGKEVFMIGQDEQWDWLMRKRLLN